ncbi:MAG: flagellar biosynthesis anti-sigma factor FlgM [Fimbriimonadales bacterium]|nr:flagellar biosynthesis anti-sigma factor FlgM [Fimbriimonadales bacterium]MDW8051802.1 flagellar biosynthesis anti-sigma factor FlgM [Armatimonadota bacterium]
MQISPLEAQRVARILVKLGTYSLETVPAPFTAPAAEDERLARELARELVNSPDVRAERVEEVRKTYTANSAKVPARTIAEAIVRRALADGLKP